MHLEYNYGMTTNSVPFALPGFEIDEIRTLSGKMLIWAHATQTEAACPDCQQVTCSVHSRYTRLVQDLPVSDQAVDLHLQVRRFRCRTPRCERQTFVEQHPALVLRNARRTVRLTTSFLQIGLALGGAAGARLAPHLQRRTSDDSLLRQLKQVAVTAPASPRVIGIDDWAWRKGRVYGTIVVDLEQHCPIDLLPTRQGSDVVEWLRRHPSVTIVARDRSSEYATAITEGAPQAMQVADRWHLLVNLREALERYLTRLHPHLRKLTREDNGEANKTASFQEESARRYKLDPRLQVRQDERQVQRAERFAAMKERYEQGAYITQIAHEFGLSRQTVSKWLHSDTVPPDGRGYHLPVAKIDPFVPYLEQRLAEGCTNQSQLWREIRERGFTGNRSLVGRWVRARTPPFAKQQNKPTPLPPPKRLVWVLLRDEKGFSAEEQVAWERIQHEPDIQLMRDLAQQYGQIIRQRLPDQLDAWLTACEESDIAELSNFATVLRRDYAAVKAALTEPWSSGQVEGQVNRLKLIKRSMYGRAGFSLLRARVLLAA